MARAHYREYPPCAALRPYVKSLFTFTRTVAASSADESSWSAMFADSGVSLVFCFGDGYSIGGLWHPRRAQAHVIGPMTAFHHSSPGESLVQVGAYLLPEFAFCFLGVPTSEIANRVLALDSFWREAHRVEDRLAATEDPQARIAVLEAALIRRLNARDVSIAAPAAMLARRSKGQTTVDALAASAGVSRQLFSRVFREQLGLSPKLYLRLCRFRAALRRPWFESAGAGAAAEAGYFDQSHMIAEFREFSGLTPAAIARQRPFHPFIVGEAAPGLTAPGSPAARR